MPLTTISAAKDLSAAYQPLLLAEVRFLDGSYLRLSSENLDATRRGHQYQGHDWQPRITKQSLASLQAAADAGIITAPQLELELADADGALWNTWEAAKGFKGATLTLKFVFWDAGTGTFSSDEQIKFKGICNPPQVDDSTLTLSAVNLLNMQKTLLPTVPISRHCPWIFPTTAAEREAGANDESSNFWHCGYSPDVSGGVGNLNGSEPYTTCGYTWEDCVARLGNASAATRSNSDSTKVQIEADQAGHPTGRFGGVRFDPPGSWLGKAYVTGSNDQGLNNPNEAKYQDWFPMVYGKAFVEPPVMQVLGDPNGTRFEVALCVGQIHDNYSTRGPVERVIVNDYEVPFITESPDQKLFNWNWVSVGARNGHVNRAPIYDGQGDPYGSVAAICIIVPKRIADSATLPRVRVLTAGPKIKEYTGSDPGSYNLVSSWNSAFITADLLQWANWPESELDIRSIYDASAICVPPVTYQSLTGASSTHQRYKTGLVLRQRQTAAEVIRQLTAGFKGTLAPNAGIGTGNQGKLQLFIEQTLADQQANPVPGSNKNTPVTSAAADGSAASGYVAYSFDESNIARAKSGRGTSFRLIQKPITDTPNRLTVTVQDEDYQFATDTYSKIDTRDVGRIGQELPGGVAAIGLVNLDQAKRVLETQYAKNYRGNPRADSGGTWQVELDTTFRVVHLRVGHIVEVSWPKLNLANQLFRVTAISPEANFERVRLRLQWHEDDWYLDSYGQHPDPILQQRRRNGVDRLPLTWQPDYAAPAPGDSLHDATERNFAIAQSYASAADGSKLATVTIRGYAPINDLSTKLQPPYAPQATAGSGGTVPAGTYYLALVAIDSDGKRSPLSSPPARATLASAGALTLTNIYWHSDTVGYEVYAGRDPNRLSFQGSGSGTPGSVNVSAYQRLSRSAPDPQFNKLRIRVKRVAHAGVLGAAITARTATTITVAGAAWTTNQWAGYDVSVLGLNHAADLPVATFRTASNTSDTLTLTSSGGVTPNLTTLGILVGDAIVIRTKPDSVTSNTIGDSGFVNLLSGGAGFDTDAEKGRLLRIIAGTGAGQSKRITGNSASTLAIEGTWDVTPDATSRFIIEEEAWLLETTTTPGTTATPGRLLEAALSVDNMRNQALRVEVTTLSADGRESLEAEAPWREIYLFGDETTFDITQPDPPGNCDFESCKVVPVVHGTYPADYLDILSKLTTPADLSNFGGVAFYLDKEDGSQANTLDPESNLADIGLADYMQSGTAWSPEPKGKFDYPSTWTEDLKVREEAPGKDEVWRLYANSYDKTGKENALVPYGKAGATPSVALQARPVLTSEPIGGYAPAALNLEFLDENGQIAEEGYIQYQPDAGGNQTWRFCIQWAIYTFALGDINLGGYDVVLRHFDGAGNTVEETVAKINRPVVTYTLPWRPVPDPGRRYHLILVPFDRSGNRNSIEGGVITETAFFVEYQKGEPGREYTEPALDVQVFWGYTLNLDGARVLRIRSTVIDPARPLTTGGYIAHLIRGGVDYTLSGLEDGPRLTNDITDFPTADEEVTYWISSADVRGLGNSYVFGVTPAQTFTITAPTGPEGEENAPAGASVDVAYSYQTNAAGHRELKLVGTLNDPNANEATAGYIAFLRRSSVDYQLTGTEQGPEFVSYINEYPSVPESAIYYIVTVSASNGRPNSYVQGVTPAEQFTLYPPDSLAGREYCLNPIPGSPLFSITT